MATTKIIIREGKINQQGKCVVYVQYCHQEKTVLFSTKVKVPPKSFDWGNGRVRKGLTGYTSLNNLISKKEGEVIKAYTDLMLKDIDPTINEVRTEVNPEANGKKKAPKDTRLTALFAEFVELKKKTTRKNTAKQYPVTLGKLKSFLKANGTPDVRIERVNYALLEKFNLWLLESLAPGSVNNHIKRLKSFLQNEYYKGQYKTQDFKTFKLNEDKSPEQDKIYLTGDELKTLYEKEMPSERLEKVRDLFVLACCAGLRYSDLSNLRKEHIDNDIIRLTTVKQDKPLEIPLFLYAKPIIEKYNGHGLPKISNQKMNKYLKEVCEIAEINSKRIVPTWRGKDRKDEVFSKFDLISSHTGKKTFVMLCVAAGVDIERVAAITGNSTATLKHYYEINSGEKARILKGVELYLNQA